MLDAIDGPLFQRVRGPKHARGGVCVRQRVPERRRMGPGRARGGQGRRWPHAGRHSVRAAREVAWRHAVSGRRIRAEQTARRRRPKPSVLLARRDRLSLVRVRYSHLVRRRHGSARAIRRRPTLVPRAIFGRRAFCDERHSQSPDASARDQTAPAIPCDSGQGRTDRDTTGRRPDCGDGRPAGASQLAHHVGLPRHLVEPGAVPWHTEHQLVHDGRVGLQHGRRVHSQRGSPQAVPRAPVDERPRARTPRNFGWRPIGGRPQPRPQTHLRPDQHRRRDHRARLEVHRHGEQGRVRRAGGRVHRVPPGGRRPHRARRRGARGVPEDHARWTVHRRQGRG